MPANDRRKRRDRRAGLLIRATSVLVLLLIAGMVLQLVSAALPLLGERSLVELPAPPDDIARTLADAAQPDWLPKEEQTLRWYESSQRRVWLMRNPNGDIVGEHQRATDDSGNWQVQNFVIRAHAVSPDFFDISAAGNWLVLFDQQGQFALTALHGSNPDRATFLNGPLPAHKQVLPMPGHRAWLLLEQSGVTQVHLVTREGRPALETLRSLPLDEEIALAATGPSAQLLALVVERSLQVWNMTDAKLLASVDLDSQPVQLSWSGSLSLSIVDAAGRQRDWRLQGLDSGASWERLFGLVHYEGYREPSRTWQPGSSAAGYEVKIGLSPLLTGTLKAALVALVMALPLAVGSAIFVGFFMSVALRNRIKPTIELIAAFPTVVLGAVTALWLAPHFMSVIVELLAAMVFIPVGVVLLAFLWRRHPVSRQTGRYLPKVPFILIPVVFLFGALGLLVGYWLESTMPGGSLTTWLDSEFGIVTQQRNALIVGVALGFAIIPTIFSVAEDAIHAVPKSAAIGSLALGATQWQSFREVVMPVAMPGVLSAVMLGFGRAMGETMILLLVAGNAPLDSWSLVEGLRSISATLAIELTESPVGSAHYRVLFFASLLLFFLTFTFNTVAQLLKRHLRRQYGLDL